MLSLYFHVFCFDESLLLTHRLVVLLFGPSNQLIHKLASQVILSLPSGFHFAQLPHLGLNLWQGHNVLDARSKECSFVEQHVYDLAEKAGLYLCIGLIDNESYNLVQILAREGSVESDQLVQNAAKHPHVGLRVVRLAHANLGRQVVRSSQRRRSHILTCIKRFGNPEIANPNLLILWIARCQ